MRNGRAPDYYAVLQVQPTAEPEVIEAAYRGLMKLYHPDRAGEEPRRIAEYEARAKLLNEAFAVLRDPEQRARYDSDRRLYGFQAPSAPPPPPSSRRRPPPTPPPSPPAGEVVIVRPPESSLPAPLALISAAYYLLPGPYEWEDGSRKELLTVGLLPVVGVTAFLLATGRFNPLLGHSPYGTLVAWVLVLLLCLPVMRSLPRIAVAGGPSLMLLTGSALPMLQQAHIPVWFAWGMASLVSVVLAARLFVFGVLPTVAACWLIARVT